MSVIFVSCWWTLEMRIIMKFTFKPCSYICTALLSYIITFTTQNVYDHGKFHVLERLPADCQLVGDTHRHFREGEGQQKGGRRGGAGRRLAAGVAVALC